MFKTKKYGHLQCDLWFCARPQPYRALKESDSADGEDVGSPEKAREPLPPSPLLSSKASEVNLLEDIFPSLEVEAQPQPLSQAKSLEDLRTPKEEAEQRCSFEYQVGGFLCPRGGTELILRNFFVLLGRS